MSAPPTIPCPYSPVTEAAARAICKKKYLDPDEVMGFYHPSVGAFSAPIWWEFTAEVEATS